MDKELTREEVAARARELARRTMAKSPEAKEAYKGRRALCQAKKARANWRGVLGVARPPPSEAFVLAAVQRDGGAFGVVNAQLNAGVPADGELVQIPLKVLFATILINAGHTALEHAEHAFEGIRGHQIGAFAASIFAGSVVDRP